MHRALHVNEIVTEIMSYLVIPRSYARHPAYGQRPASLFACALTCRAFSERALDALWQSPSVWDLASCMKSSIWRVIEEHDEQGRMQRRLIFSPPHEDAAALEFGTRFFLYANRVRTLDLRVPHAFYDASNGACEVDKTVLLAWFTSTSQLFPRYHELYLDTLYAGWILIPTFLNAVLQPMVLTVLELDFVQEPIANIMSSRDALLKVCAHLQELDISVYSEEDGDYEAWTALHEDMLLRTRRLRSLRTSLTISYRTLWHLMSSSIKHLKLGGVADVPNQDLTLPPGAFSQLRFLELRDTTPSVSLIQSLLTFSPTAHMETCVLRLAPRDMLTILDLGAVMTRIGRHVSLNMVLLEANDMAEPITAETSAAFFQPLHSLAELRSLYISVDFAWPITEDIIISLIDACPWLVFWTISNHRETGWEGDPRLPVPFMRFLKFLEHGPNIQRLPVCVTASDLPDATARATLDQHDEYGPWLHAYYPEDPAALEEAVRELLPGVRVLSIRQADDSSKNIQL